MKLLIVTQKVDRSDPVLGFFHRWIAEFASVCSHVTVVGQMAGERDLPGNVRVASLGKENGVSLPAQILTFWRTAYAFRGEYDAVFVHMTPIWVVLGWPLWFVLQKPVFLWYEARGARWPLRVALHMVRAVFSASSHGLPIASRKSVVTGHGIDTHAFRPSGTARDPDFLLTVGRVTAAKRLHLLIDCLGALPVQTRLRIVGGPVTDADAKTLQDIRESVAARNLTEHVEIGTLPNDWIIPLLQTAAVFLHASETSLDKAVLEAMACGCPVVSCADAAKTVLPEACRATPSTLATVVEDMLAKTPEERVALGAALRETVERDHSLPRLITRLCAIMSGTAQ